MSATEQSVRSRPDRLTVARHDAAERHRHLSAVLQQIRDDGPALSAGSAPLAAQNLPPKQTAIRVTAANDARASASVQDMSATAVSRSPRYLASVCLTLAVALACSIGYSAWLQMRITAMEAQVQALVTQYD